MPTIFDGYAESDESLTSVFREFASRGYKGGSASGHGLNYFLMVNDRSLSSSPTGRVHDVPGRERSRVSRLSCGGFELKCSPARLRFARDSQQLPG